MLIERSEITVRAGAEEGFDDAMRASGAALLRGVPGVRAVSWGRGVENPTKFMLLVEWDTMDAHDGFRSLPANGELRALIGQFSVSGAMEHFEMKDA